MEKERAVHEIFTPVTVLSEIDILGQDKINLALESIEKLLENDTAEVTVEKDIWIFLQRSLKRLELDSKIWKDRISRLRITGERLFLEAEVLDIIKTIILTSIMEDGWMIIMRLFTDSQTINGERLSKYSLESIVEAVMRLPEVVGNLMYRILQK